MSTRALTIAGIPTRRIYASLVVDMTTEMAGQLVYTLFGLALMTSILIGDGAAASLRPAILGGAALMIFLILLFFSMQRLALDFASTIAARFLPQSVGAFGGVREELSAIYARRERVFLSFAFNLAAWVTSALGAWLALHLMGVSISVWEMMSLECIIFTLRSVAFAIPGAIGVQEVAYALAGPLFGLPAETALALSLAKRAKDVAIGLPALLIWQLSEVRAIASKS